MKDMRICGEVLSRHRIGSEVVMKVVVIHTDRTAYASDFPGKV